MSSDIPCYETGCCESLGSNMHPVSAASAETTAAGQESVIPVTLLKDTAFKCMVPVGWGFGLQAVIPALFTSIGDEAFQSCCCLTSVEIPVSITAIGHTGYIHN